MLTDVARFTPVVPAAVCPAASLKGWVAAEQNVGDDAQRPEITALVVSQVGLLLRHRVHVIEIVKVEDLDNLRCHVLGRADRALQPRRGDGLIDRGAEIEVAELDGAG